MLVFYAQSTMTVIWWWWWWWLLLYSAILRSRADSLRSHVILHEWLAFYSAVLHIHRSDVLTALAWLVPRETAAVSAQVLCTPYNHAPCHFMQSHIRKVYACLAVTCHLHFWQNDRDLLRATAVTHVYVYGMCSSGAVNMLCLCGNSHV